MADNPPTPDDDDKRTVFGEPFWVDALKTLGVAAATIGVMVVIGVFLGLMIIAPWGRASHDCSMFCVMKEQIASWFEEEQGQ